MNELTDSTPRDGRGDLELQTELGDAVDVSTTRCVVIGGGPAGVVFSYLLARHGVDVTLLEGHKDFDRKFRGDTIHSSVLEVLDQLGLAQPLHELRHVKAYGPTIQTKNGPFKPLNFSRLKSKFNYIMLLPQVEFLNFMVAQAKEFPSFHLRMGAKVSELVRDDGQVLGVRYHDDDGTHEVQAELTVAADGRFSRLRHLVGIQPQRTSPPMDVLWFNLPKLETGPQIDGLFARFGAGRALLVFDRADHLQVGYVFAKGRYSELKQQGFAAFKKSIIAIEPGFAPHLEKLDDWTECMLLSVESSCCDKWFVPGMLMIGDAAHAMSPVGGVGINYAIHDAVEAANLLAAPLAAGRVDTSDLRKFQDLRLPVIHKIQKVQALVQKNLVARVLTSDEPLKIPWFVRLLAKVPVIRDLPAKTIGIGYGPSKVRI